LTQGGGSEPPAYQGDAPAMSFIPRFGHSPTGAPGERGRVEFVTAIPLP
jgi:hypothetical protein